jgi:translation initiation factor 5A
MASEDHEFETADAGSSLTYPMQAGALRKGGYCMLKGFPCKLIEITTSKTGKHGHAKAAITGIDIFTDKKVEDMTPTSHNMEVPNVTRTEYQLIDLDPDAGSVSVLLENGDTKDDLNLAKKTDGNYDEVSEKIIAAFEKGDAILVTVLAAMNKEKIVAFKEMQ